MAEPQSPKQGSRPGAMTQAMQAVPGKQSGSKVLRVGLFRDKKIVEERIVRRRETVSIGTAAKNHLIIRSGDAPRKARVAFRALPVGWRRLHPEFHLRDERQDRASGRSAEARAPARYRRGPKRGNALPNQACRYIAWQHQDRRFHGLLRVRRGATDHPEATAAGCGPARFRQEHRLDVHDLGDFSYMLFFGFIIYMENADWKVDKGSQEVPESLARLVFEAPIEPPTVQEELVEEGEGEEKEEAEGKAPEKQPSKAAGKGPVGAEQAGESAEGRARIAQEAAAQAEAMLLGALGGSGGALGDVLSGGAVTGNAADVLAQASGVWRGHQERGRHFANAKRRWQRAERRSRLAEEGPGRRQGRPRRASHPRTRGSRRRRPEQRWRHWRER